MCICLCGSADDISVWLPYYHRDVWNRNDCGGGTVNCSSVFAVSSDTKRIFNISWKGECDMGTAIVLTVVVIGVILAVRSMIRDKKQGKSLQCGCDCKNCSGGCH